MLSVVVKAQVDQLLGDLGDEQPFMQALAAVSSGFGPVIEALASIAQGGNNATSGGTTIHGHLANFNRLLTAVDLRQFYASLEVTRAGLLRTDLPEASRTELQALANDIEKFGNAFGAYMKAQTPQNATKLVTEGYRAHTHILGFKSGLRVVGHGLEIQGPQNAETGELSIILTSTLGIRDIAERLTALDDIYTELAMLMGISIGDAPLRVAKIESGSLWVKILGSLTVLTLIAKLIVDWVSYMYRNYTPEGKIASIQQTSGSYDALLGLSNRMQEQGIDVSEMQETIRKGGVTLAHHLNTLVEGQVEISINDERYSLLQELQQKLTAPAELPRLALDDDPDAELDEAVDGDNDPH